MYKKREGLRVAALILAAVVLSVSSVAEALPFWRRGEAEGQEEALEGYEAYEGEPEIYAEEPRRREGPFIWVVMGFMLTVFVMSL